MRLDTVLKLLLDHKGFFLFHLVYYVWYLFHVYPLQRICFEFSDKGFL